jgi:hypothetical protein
MNWIPPVLLVILSISQHFLGLKKLGYVGVICTFERADFLQIQSREYNNFYKNSMFGFRQNLII